MVFRVVSVLMTVLLAVAVAVQYNDPDPIRWMAIYGAACALSALVVVRGRAPSTPVLVVGLVALVWGLIVAQGAYRSVAPHRNVPVLGDEIAGG